MPMRPLGRTGLNVSTCTFGTDGLLRSPGGRGEATAALALALERGVNAIEVGTDDPDLTAFVGTILAGAGACRRVDVLARPVPVVRMDLPSPHILAGQAYPGAHLRQETERLLRTLRVERIAVLQLHAWCAEWLREGDWFETAMRLKEEGKIAGVGISLFDHDLEAAPDAVASGMIDTVQLMYNIFDPAAGARLLPLCAAHGVAVIARAPFYHGILVRAAERPDGFAEGDWRREFFFAAHLDECRRRAAAIEADIAEPLDGTALAFTLSAPAIATVAVGMTSRAHVEANLASAAAPPLPAGTIERLRRHRWLC